jgi:hypothetical protein
MRETVQNHVTGKFFLGRLEQDNELESGELPD